MVNRHTITLCREIVDAKTVVSKIQTDGVIVHVKSIFNGNRDIGDIIFDFAKNNKDFLKQHIKT